MGNDFHDPNFDQVPHPSEAYEGEFADLKRSEGQSPEDIRLEDFFLEHLSEDYTDEDLNDDIHELVKESRGNIPLAELLLTREKLKAHRHHPSYAAVSQEVFDQKTDEIDQQIAELKDKLDGSDRS